LPILFFFFLALFSAGPTLVPSSCLLAHQVSSSESSIGVATARGMAGGCGAAGQQDILPPGGLAVMADGLASPCCSGGSGGIFRLLLTLYEKRDGFAGRLLVQQAKVPCCLLSFVCMWVGVFHFVCYNKNHNERNKP
jgi:hypothetical protein